MSYYTSYETSVALKDAGAPQRAPDDQHTYIWAVAHAERLKREPFVTRYVGTVPEDKRDARAWRLDEILAALAEATWQADRGVRVDSPSGCVDEWSVTVETTTSRRRKRHAKGEDVSLVESAAACWLAVLRAAREAAK